MYDELERAAGTRSRSGISVLGWIGVALATLTLLGATGAFFAYRYVRAQVEDVVDQFEARAPIDSDLAPVVARTVARTLGEIGAAGDVDDEDLTAVVARALAAREAAPPQTSRGAESEEVEGVLRIRTGDGEFTANLRADDQGGTLVVRDADGEVLFDLSGDADGGRLFIRGEGEIAHVVAGSAAEAPPRWVPAVGSLGAGARPVVSGHAGDGSFGALTWTAGDAATAIVEAFRADLEDGGWEIRAEHRLHGIDEPSASVVGHEPDSRRTVLLTAVEEEPGVTRVVLGWGEPSAGR